MEFIPSEIALRCAILIVILPATFDRRETRREYHRETFFFSLKSLCNAEMNRVLSLSLSLTHSLRGSGGEQKRQTILP